MDPRDDAQDQAQECKEFGWLECLLAGLNPLDRVALVLGPEEQGYRQAAELPSRSATNVAPCWRG